MIIADQPTAIDTGVGNVFLYRVIYRLPDGARSDFILASDWSRAKVAAREVYPRPRVLFMRRMAWPSREAFENWLKKQG